AGRWASWQRRRPRRRVPTTFAPVRAQSSRKTGVTSRSASCSWQGDGQYRPCTATGVARAPDAGAWPLREAAAAKLAQRVEGVAARLPGEAQASLPRAALVLPIAQADKGAAAGNLVVGLRDFHAFDGTYRGFPELVAGQIGSAIARVGALEEERQRAQIRREAARRESELRAEVRQAQEHAVVILESITDGFLALDRDWRFTYVNAE